MKLTEAQVRTLRRLAVAGNSICQSVHTGSCWTRDGQFSIRVHSNVFNALALRGLIEKKGATSMSSFYEITDLGRAALEQEGKANER